MYQLQMLFNALVLNRSRNREKNRSKVGLTALSEYDLEQKWLSVENSDSMIFEIQIQA